jgi:hypothetical protein
VESIIRVTRDVAEHLHPYRCHHLPPISCCQFSVLSNSSETLAARATKLGSLLIPTSSPAKLGSLLIPTSSPVWESFGILFPRAQRSAGPWGVRDLQRAVTYCTGAWIARGRPRAGRVYSARSLSLSSTEPNPVPSAQLSLTCTQLSVKLPNLRSPCNCRFSTWRFLLMRLLRGLLI